MAHSQGTLATLKYLAELKLISDLDYQFARFVAQQSPQASDSVLLAAALISNQTSQGNVCTELSCFADSSLFGTDKHPETEPLIAPRRAAWRKALLSADGLVSVDGCGLMTLDAADRLYLSKYWHFESQLAMALRSRAQSKLNIDQSRLRMGLQRLFPANNPDIDWQQIAAAIAVLKPFAVISGGPGTGKTTTVTKLLALLVEQGGAATPPRISLAAPTGKAAARLSESIKEKKLEIDCTAQVRDGIPDEATTLHRLLGVIPGKVGFRHNRNNPLHLDILVVDEASMIDLPLMARLLEALPAQARLIMLGDRDQLASVEAGSVLGDICQAGLRDSYSAAMCDQIEQLTGHTLMPLKQLNSPLNDCIALLRKSYRFDSAGGIGVLALAVNQGQIKQARNSFDDLFNDDIALADISPHQLPQQLGKHALSHYRDYLASDGPVEALHTFNRFRVLCALREGPFGIEQINKHIEKALNQHHIIDARQRFYAGRPVMITRNDYGLKLFNGDIGLIWPDSENGRRLRAFFIMPDGQLRKILPNRLPQHETVYAMTVHKSQGSEFERVLLILPDELSQVVSRELLYTGITRAKKQMTLWSPQAIFEQAVKQRLERASGLVDSLSGT